jgi:uncharacterized protein YdhG (YjbR/CyaY superfamily)
MYYLKLKAIMTNSGNQPTSVDDYIESFPPEVRVKLEELRAAIRACAPDAEEAIKYRMPTFVLNGNLVHFAAFKNHIGFFPTSSPIVAFEKELSKYKTSKGTIQFPMDQPIPLNLVRRIVKFRVERSLAKARGRGRA